MKKILFSIITTSFIIGLFGFSIVLAKEVKLAQMDALNLLTNTQPYTGYAAANEQTLTILIGRIINIFLGLVGTLFLVFTVYAGYLWLTAGGDTKKIDTSKAYLKNGIIGIIITLSAFGISTFIINALISSGVINP